MNLLDFLRETNRLKKVRRTGWVERGVKDAETTAEHSFMVTLQALVLGSGRGLDTEKLLKMAIIHDIADSQIGDLITKENWEGGGTVTEKEKHQIEKKALEKLLNFLGPEMKNDFMNLWLEFEEGKTKEAAFLKGIDRFEAIFQALEYQREGNYKKPLQGFWDEKSISLIKDKELRELILKHIKNKK